MSEIRHQVLRARREISKESVRLQSASIIQRFLSGPATQVSWQPLKLALYRALPDEVSLLPLEKFLRNEGAHLAFPRVINRDSRQIDFFSTDDLDSPASWKVGPYGVAEPHDQAPWLEPTLLDCVFVPGAAFSEKGGRVGMGGGYYDRFLPRVPDAIRIALIFDLQLLAEIPQNSWDQPVDWIVTESREILFPRAHAWLGAQKALKTSS